MTSFMHSRVLSRCHSAGDIFTSLCWRLSVQSGLWPGLFPAQKYSTQVQRCQKWQSITLETRIYSKHLDCRTIINMFTVQNLKIKTSDGTNSINPKKVSCGIELTYVPIQPLCHLSWLNHKFLPLVPPLPPHPATWQSHGAFGPLRLMPIWVRVRSGALVYNHPKCRDTICFSL